MLFNKSLDFTEQFTRVVEWNALARNGQHDFSEAAMDFQYSLVGEEIEGKDEMLDGYKNNDKKMYLDGLCDTFVTSAYLYFQEIADKNWKPELTISMPSPSVDYLKQLQYSYKAIVSGALTLKDACALLFLFDGCSSEALNEVLNSNDSKFPPVLTDEKGEYFLDVQGKRKDPKRECKAIEKRSEARYEGVTYSIVGEGDNRKFIFKSNKGKIVKPCSFFEPNLSQFC